MNIQFISHFSNKIKQKICINKIKDIEKVGFKIKTNSSRVVVVNASP